jgi:hypothetical protein
VRLISAGKKFASPRQIVQFAYQYVELAGSRNLTREQPRAHFSRR